MQAGDAEERLQHRAPAGRGHAQCTGHLEGPLGPVGWHSTAPRPSPRPSSASTTSPAQVRARHTQPASLSGCAGALHEAGATRHPPLRPCALTPGPEPCRASVGGGGRGAVSSAPGLPWGQGGPSRVLCLPTTQGRATKKGVRRQRDRAGSPQLPEMETVGPEGWGARRAWSPRAAQAARGQSAATVQPGGLGQGAAPGHRSPETQAPETGD